MIFHSPYTDDLGKCFDLTAIISFKIISYILLFSINYEILKTLPGIPKKMVEIHKNITKQNKLLKLEVQIVSEDEQRNMKAKQ
jgi:hypothetical protein